MADWLVIALRAPFASFADSPGNAARKTGDMPTRSALIGLAAAALGTRREDAAGQRGLAQALVTASALIEPGAILSDFHTFQSLNQAAKGARTRAKALSKRQHLETAITRRDYRTDTLWQSAYRMSATPGELTLEKLAQAFRHPVFSLYVGRRSCPPSLPLNPLIVAAPDVREAFAEQARSSAGRLGAPIAFSLEIRHDVSGSNSFKEHRRRDDPRDRSIRWTFAERAEWRVAAVVEDGQ